MSKTLPKFDQMRKKPTLYQTHDTARVIKIAKIYDSFETGLGFKTFLIFSFFTQKRSIHCPNTITRTRIIMVCYVLPGLATNFLMID